MGLLAFGIVLFFACPVGQITAAFDHGRWKTGAAVSTERMNVVAAVAPAGILIQSRRAPTRHVGAVMAILGTFNEAGVLPPEADPRANQLIRSLIQFQSLFMKSQEPEVQAYFSSALSQRWGAEGSTILDSFYKQGWTSESLEAVVEYSRQYPMWENPRIEAVFHAYNLSQADWALIEQLFLEARQRFVSQNQDLHTVFAQQRLGMPGGKR